MIPNWRIKAGSYPLNNRGFRQHDAVLQQMTQGDERDKHLMQVLSDVVSQSTAVSSVQNDDEEYVEEEDYDDDDISGNAEESDSEEGQSYFSGNGEGTNEDNSNSNDGGDQSNIPEDSTSQGKHYICI